MAFLLQYFAWIVLFHVLTDGRRIPKSSHHMQRSGWTRITNGSYGFVETLQIFDSSLTELEPNVFHNHGFNNLTKAILRCISIKEIHNNAFARMQNIVQLDLYGNHLSVFSMNSFAGLNSLKDLNLGNNKIQFIDDAVLKPLQSLEMLDLSSNALVTLQKTLIQHTSILELNLDNNSLALEEKGPVLESATLLRLHLQLCDLQNLHPDSFSGLPNLEYLDLSRNQLRSLAAGLLVQTPQLSFLDISYNWIPNVGAEVFYLPSKLEDLYCDGNLMEVDPNCTQLLNKIRNLKHSSTKQGLNDHLEHDETLNELKG